MHHEGEMPSTIAKLIKFVLMSATIHSFRTERGHETRGAINMWLNAPFGTGKTSLISPLAQEGLAVLIHDYTVAGLVGTIKRTGLVTIGEIRNLADNTAILEEFQNTPKTSRAILLALMEEHKYSRILGFEILKPENIEESGFCFRAEGTRLSIQLRASFIVLSMTYNTPSMLENALLSRCIPVFLDTSIDEQADLFVKGHSVQVNAKDVKRAREELKGLSVTIPARVRERIAKKYRKTQMKPEFLTRAMWDFVRVSYLTAYESGENEITKEAVEETEWLIEVQQLGYAKRTLTKTAYEIYLMLANSDKPLTASEVATKMNLSREHTSRILNELVKRKLAKKAQVSKKVCYFVEKEEESEEE